MKNWKNWSEMDWFEHILVLMSITAVFGSVIYLFGHLLIGQIIIWTAVGVDGIAVIIRWRTRK